MSLPLEFAQEGRESVAKLIGVSLKALDEEARAVFVAMGAFFAPQVTAEMVGLYFEQGNGADAGTGHVSAMPLQHDAALATLVQHGLVTRPETPTPTLTPPLRQAQSGADSVQGRESEDVPAYRLHDPAYSYARAQNGDAQRGRALEACLAYVARYNEPSLPNFAALRPELDNLLNAAGWAFGTGKVGDGEDFVAKLYVGPNTGGGFLFYQGFASQSTHLLQQAADAAGRAGSKRDQGTHLGNLGTAYYSLGQFDKAAAYYQQSIQISREIGDRIGKANDLNNIGALREVQEDYAAALNYFQQARAIFAEIGAQHLVKEVDANIAEARAKLAGGCGAGGDAGG